MEEKVEDSHDTKPRESGRVLSSDEATFLLDYLLESQPVVVVGLDDAKKAQKHSSKA